MIVNDSRDDARGSIRRLTTVVLSYRTAINPSPYRDNRTYTAKTNHVSRNTLQPKGITV
jgi:hypothetical protein